ncbi:hypothetical protein [Natrinema gelatinilyticum]|uniref:hypothetical protein n=1 Tax=Natrinema gelatinilyticum TaxID=2961571 RepID=UPI0020C3752A|nr:hypothetical protein [Natrinema gelatinilyticum]
MSLTTWKRLEPRTRSETLNARRAAVHDPLWLLGRQWQFGELEGEDAGSPVTVSYSMASDPVTWYQPGEATPKPYTASEGPPLEALVEQEAVRPRPDADRIDVRQAAEAGEHFLRLLGTHDVIKQDSTPVQPSDLEGFVLDADEWSANELKDDGQRYSMVVSGRVLDGTALFHAFEDETTSDPVPEGVSPTDTGYLDAVKAYREWYRDLYDEPEVSTESAWDPSRMEYRFAVSTGTGENETVFEAKEYTTGRIDWHSFSVAENRSLANEAKQQSGETELPSTETPAEKPEEEKPEEEKPEEEKPEEEKPEERRMVPTAATYPGMPKPRYWEFEEGTVNLPAIEMAAEDLPKLVVQEFGLVAGDDWFVVPVELDVGSLARIKDLIVTTTFGKTYPVESIVEEDAAEGDSGWNMYAFTNTGKEGEPGLFLPPMLADSLETDPVEEVEFARDEMANVGWAIEHRIEGSIGQPYDRDEARASGDESEPTVQGSLGDGDVEDVYRLMTHVPENWYPLVPQQESSEAIRLLLGRLLTTDPGEMSEPKGRVLGTSDLTIPEAEVPRAGTTVTRTYQLARWMDGTTHLWSGRTATPGRGETSSGLQFDVLETHESE